ncbi:hypothetical protein TWF694_005418 [Orbilia ellipsospora]|uniref:Amidohydrolase-related domain-containing protein n=1 Tax=Orbilia ellipsospora TaxID=2528407 RepID=A0AAV9WUD4_9PEZI
MPPPHQLIDTHVHLFRSEDLPTITWQTPGGPLWRPHGFSEYLGTAPIPSFFSGFIFVETNRKTADPKDPSEDQTAWKHVLEEYRYILQVSKTNQGRKLVKGIVAWAPVHLGRVVMERYQKLLLTIDAEIYGSESHDLLVGFSCPMRTEVSSEYIEGLKFIKNIGLVFNLTVNVQKNGLGELEQALQILNQVKGLKVVINHLANPPLERKSVEDIHMWTELMREVARLNCYMKLSGVFSQLPSGIWNRNEEFPYEQVAEMVLDYMRPILRELGPQRIIWGGDWPICRLGYEKVMGQQLGSWKGWLDVSVDVLNRLQKEGDFEANAEDWKSIWGKNAIQVYNLREGTEQ